MTLNICPKLSGSKCFVRINKQGLQPLGIVGPTKIPSLFQSISGGWTQQILVRSGLIHQSAHQGHQGEVRSLRQ